MTILPETEHHRAVGGSGPLIGCSVSRAGPCAGRAACMSAQSACRPIPPPLSLPPLSLSSRCLVIRLGSSHLGQHKKALREELGGLVGASIRQGGSVAPRAMCMSANLNVLGLLYVSLPLYISLSLSFCVCLCLSLRMFLSEICVTKKGLAHLGQNKKALREKTGGLVGGGVRQGGSVRPQGGVHVRQRQCVQLPHVTYGARPLHEQLRRQIMCV
jgi:hypothetical protein